MLTESVKTVASIEEAEDWFIDNAPINAYNLSDIGKSEESSDTEATTMGIGILIMRTANIIAQNSRRGQGNVVLMSEKRAAQMLSPNPFSIINPHGVPPQPPIGRWTNVGKFNNSLHVWTSEDFPDDKIVIAFMGSSLLDAMTVQSVNDGYRVFAPLTPTDDLVRVISLIN